MTLTTDALGRTASAAFDADGRQTSETDGNNQQTVTTYDFAGEPVSIKRPDGSVLKKNYNLDGTLHQTIDGAGNPTTYGYDGQGREKSRQDAKNRTTTATLDAAGYASTIKDPDNRTITYTHNAAGQVL